MPATHATAVDLAKVYADPQRHKFLRFLALGDVVEVIDITSKHLEIRTPVFEQLNDDSVRPTPRSGFIVPTRTSGLKPGDIVVPRSESKVLSVEFVDVQQGDGAVLVSPSGKVVLIDGGDNQLFARYLAGQFRGTSLQQPKEIDCIVVTHGDADHFSGLTEILDSESRRTTPWKQLFINPRRVYHNGLVKRPTKRPDGRERKETEMLGATVEMQGRPVIVGLEDDLLQVPDAEMNRPFKAWKKTLTEYSQRYGPIQMHRLKLGDDGAFDFLHGDGLQVEVLGPLPLSTLDGREGLPFLGEPEHRPHMSGHPRKFTGASASHTINGHSIVLRLTFGNVRFLFAGDLNAQAELELLKNHTAKLEAEVLKVPHHGSADFSPEFMRAVQPVVSVISSGDESEDKEYIHPRAALVGALGRHSRLDEPLVLCTELAAFFAVRGFVGTAWHQMQPGFKKSQDSRVVDLTDPKHQRFFAFSRSAFGIVRMRTDGKRLLVSTDSANVEMREAYAFEVGPGGQVIPATVRIG